MDIIIYLMGIMIGLTVGMSLAARFKQSKSGQMASTGEGGIETWAATWLVIVGGTVAVMMVPTILVASYFGVQREIADGSVYIVKQKVTNASDVYGYAVKGMLLPPEERKIREYEEDIAEMERSAPFGRLSKNDQQRKQFREEEIVRLKQKIASRDSGRLKPLK